MSCALPQWLEFSSPAVEKLYWDYFAQSWVQVDKNVSLLYIFFGSTFLHRIWAYNPWCAMPPPSPPHLSSHLSFLAAAAIRCAAPMVY